LNKKNVRDSVSNFVRAIPDHRLVFTYNDLMDPEEIRDLCPDPTFVTVATAPAFRFIINRDGVATMVPAPGSVVYGVVWQIDEIALIALDICIGMPTFFERVGGFKSSTGGQLVVAEHYAARESRLGKPRLQYLESIIRGAAKLYGFPSFYVKELEHWRL
jgi:hypothetical protein